VSKQRPHFLLGARARLPKTSSANVRQSVGFCQMGCAKRGRMHVIVTVIFVGLAALLIWVAD
jgi:hypothetical protein